MPDVIDFLETLGARPAATHGYAEAVAALDVEPAAREALLRRDTGALNALLGGRAAMWCAILSPDDSPEEAPGREEPARDDPQPDTEED